MITPSICAFIVLLIDNRLFAGTVDDDDETATYRRVMTSSSVTGSGSSLLQEVWTVTAANSQQHLAWSVSGDVTDRRLVRVGECCDPWTLCDVVDRCLGGADCCDPWTLCDVVDKHLAWSEPGDVVDRRLGGQGECCDPWTLCDVVEKHLAWSESGDSALHLLPQLLYQHIANRFQHFRSSCHADVTPSSPWWEPEYLAPEREIRRAARAEELSDQELDEEEEDACTDTEAGQVLPVMRRKYSRQRVGEQRQNRNNNKKKRKS